MRGQHGADEGRVKQVLASGMEIVHCELRRGGAVFFHCNTLHSSDINRSTNPRWGLICCYNTKANGKLIGTESHPSYEMVGSLEIWDDDELLKIGQEQWDKMASRASL